MRGETNLPRPVSRRGQWRDSYLIVAPGTPQPDAVFTFRVYGRDHHPGWWDYGFRLRDSDCRPLLQATTDDDTGRFTVAAVDKGLACAWLFPASQMRCLRAGSYQASISAADGDEDAELARLNFVVR